MIKREDIVRIGKYAKPHGVKGELSFYFTDDSFDGSECPFLISELDGIPVPFALEDYRFKSDTTALVKLKNINSEEQARMLSNKEVFFPKEYLKEPEEGSAGWNYYVGYTLVDQNQRTIGTIVAIDDSTLNILFVVETDNTELLIPAAEEIIIDTDKENKKLSVDLPDGLLDL